MTYVVLAAGNARRMGFPKVFTPLGQGGSPLERIAALLRGREGIAVVPPERAADAQRLAPALRIVPNGEPERGMVHSLRVALEHVGSGDDFAVLLGDKPFLRRATLEELETAFHDCDVLSAVDASGVPGHPVFFGPRARAAIDALPDGDAIVAAREGPALRCTRVVVSDPGAFADLDDPAAWEAADA